MRFGTLGAACSQIPQILYRVRQHILQRSAFCADRPPPGAVYTLSPLRTLREFAVQLHNKLDLARALRSSLSAGKRIVPLSWRTFAPIGTILPAHLRRCQFRGCFQRRTLNTRARTLGPDKSGRLGAVVAGAPAALVKLVAIFA